MIMIWIPRAALAGWNFYYFWPWRLYDRTFIWTPQCLLGILMKLPGWYYSIGGTDKCLYGILTMPWDIYSLGGGLYGCHLIIYSIGHLNGGCLYGILTMPWMDYLFFGGTSVCLLYIALSRNKNGMLFLVAFLAKKKLSKFPYFYRDYFAIIFIYKIGNYINKRILVIQNL